MSHPVRVALAGLLLAACGKTASEAPPAPRMHEIVGAKSSEGELAIRLERQACFGFCPVYSVTLRRDGTVAYEGKEFVSARGAHASRIAEADVEALASHLEREGFFTMTWKDPCDLIETDNPTVTLTLTRGGRSRTIVHYRGNTCFPEKLTQLEDKVDLAAGTFAWTHCDGGFCQR